MNAAPSPSATIETRSGLKLDMRAALPSEEPVLLQMFQATSPLGQQFRFVSVPAGQERLGPHIEGFLAFARGTLAAAAMLAKDASMENGEIVMVIGEDWKGNGIGCSLLEYAAAAAKQRGVRVLWSIEEIANKSGMKAALDFGFSALALENEPSLMQLEIRF